MRACPSCGTGMEAVQTDNALAGILGTRDVEFEVCGNCGGAFLDEDEFGYLTGDMTLQRHGEPASAAPLPCAACGSPMEARLSQGFPVHACARCHGLFLRADVAHRFL